MNRLLAQVRKRFVIAVVILAFLTPVSALLIMFGHDPVWVFPATFIVAGVCTFLTMALFENKGSNE